MNDIDRCKLEVLRVAIVDDHEVVLEGCRSFMLASGIGRVEAFSTAHALLDRLSTVGFDIIIVDVELPDMQADELIDAIRTRRTDAKIIAHTMHEEMWVANKLTEKHVDGVLYKTSRLDQLLQAIVAVHEGRTYYCPQFRHKQNELELQGGILSEREQEVLKEIARGYSTKEIATRLYIAENTVENHRKSLFRKLHVRNAAALVIQAITAGYLNPAEL